MELGRMWWAMLAGIVLSSAQVSHGAVMPRSDPQDEDASLQKLEDVYEDLVDAKREFEARPPIRRSLRQNRRALALAHAAPTDLDSSVGDLETKAKVASDDLAVTVEEAVQHVKDGATLKHDIAQKGVKLRIDEKKIRKLENEAGRLSETKESLFASLHRMLDSKIEVAHVRVEKKEAVLRKNEEAVQEWKNKAEDLKVISQSVIKEKHAVKQALLEAEAEVARAKEKEEHLRRKYERASQEVGEKVQKFQYAEARFKAQEAHKKAAEKAALAAKESLEELTHTMEVESQKVEQSLEYHKHQLAHKMHEVEEDREKSSQELADLKGKFADWRKDQHREKEEIAKKRREQEVASEEAAEQKRQIKQATKTKKKVEHTSFETKGDWDSWGASDLRDSDIKDSD